LRIDTLAFDSESKAFVIIEYKKGKSYSVVDQGYSYLSLLLNNKADFVLEYFEQTGKSLRKKEVDWSQSRVIFISPEFSKYQVQSIEFKDLPFELWEIKRYANNTISFYQHKPSSQESIKTIEKRDASSKKVDEEIVVYTEDDHYNYGNPEIRELCYTLRDRIMELEGLEVNPVKFYVGFKYNKKLVCDIEVQKQQVKIRVNLKKGMLKDPEDLFRDMSNVGHLGVGDYEAVVKPETDLDYLMSMIKQGYRYQAEEN
jgi:predicted transport protein